MLSEDTSTENSEALTVWLAKIPRLMTYKFLCFMISKDANKINLKVTSLIGTKETSTIRSKEKRTPRRKKKSTIRRKKKSAIQRKKTSPIRSKEMNTPSIEDISIVLSEMLHLMMHKGLNLMNCKEVNFSVNQQTSLEKGIATGSNILCVEKSSNHPIANNSIKKNRRNSLTTRKKRLGTEFI